MGFRIRRSFKLAPGVRLNISKSGISTSIGTRGATVNIGRGKTRTTVGIPGTGITYSTTSKYRGTTSGTGGAIGFAKLIFVAILIWLAISILVDFLK